MGVFEAETQRRRAMFILAGMVAAISAAMLAAMLASAAETPAVRFVDIAAQSGLTVPNTFGGKDKKDSILESTGTGAAIFDFRRRVRSCIRTTEADTSPRWASKRV
jgi:hypothetical protein